MDSYGVLKNFNGLIPGAIETIRYIIETGREFYILTNDASRSPELLAEKFHNIGLMDIQTDHIISSGMMAKEYLGYKIRGGKVVYLGTEDAAHYIEEAGLDTISISDLDLNNIDDISALVFLDDEGFDWNTDYTRKFEGNTNALHRSALDKAIEYISNNYSGEISLIDLANECGFTRVR